MTETGKQVSTTVTSSKEGTEGSTERPAFMLVTLHSPHPGDECGALRLTHDEVGIGRAPNKPSDIHVRDDLMSRLHAIFRFDREAGTYHVTDNRSNHTSIRTESARRWLRHSPPGPARGARIGLDAGRRIHCA